jgi:hypothetical protein
MMLTRLPEPHAVPGPPRTRRIRLLAASLALCAAPGLALVSPSSQATGRAPSSPSAPTDTYVSAWDAIGTQAFSAAALSPAEGQVIFAYASIAVYDSVVAIHHGYRPFAVRAQAPAGTSAEAAVAASAHRVFAHYLPAQAATILDPAYQSSLATIPDGLAKTQGITVGEQVADAFLALRAHDGFRESVPYTPPDPPIPGVWIPTAATPAVGSYNGRLLPLALDSLDQFRPDGPPSLSSRAWVKDYREVQELGSSTSTTRTAEQTLAARFWAEPPVQQARGAFRRFISDRGLDIVEAARLMAMVSVTYADAFNACFDAKYHYLFWRPITAIRAGDTDGNSKTVGDPTWTPLLPATPNHPEYPSAHSCVTPAGGLVLAEFLGTRHIDFTIPSVTGLGDRHYATVQDLAKEVANARIWGGIHFGTAVEDGRSLASEVARAVLRDNFGRIGR